MWAQRLQCLGIAHCCLLQQRSTQATCLFRGWATGAAVQLDYGLVALSAGHVVFWSWYGHLGTIAASVVYVAVVHGCPCFTGDACVFSWTGLYRRRRSRRFPSTSLRFCVFSVHPHTTLPRSCVFPSPVGVFVFYVCFL